MFLTPLPSFGNLFLLLGLPHPALMRISAGMCLVLHLVTLFLVDILGALLFSEEKQGEWVWEGGWAGGNEGKGASGKRNRKPTVLVRNNLEYSREPRKAGQLGRR